MQFVRCYFILVELNLTYCHGTSFGGLKMDMYLPFIFWDLSLSHDSLTNSITPCDEAQLWGFPKMYHIHVSGLETIPAQVFVCLRTDASVTMDTLKCIKNWSFYAFTWHCMWEMAVHQCRNCHTHVHLTILHLGHGCSILLEAKIMVIGDDFLKWLYLTR